MSTTYMVLDRDDVCVEVTENSCLYDIETTVKRGGAVLDDDTIEDRVTVTVPQRLTAEETIDVAMGLLYAVWCQHPELVEALRDEDVIDRYNAFVANKRRRKDESVPAGGPRG